MPSNPLGDIADIVMGQSPSGDTCNKSGEGLPLLNGPTEFGSYHPFPVQFTTDPRKVAMPGDLLFCVRGSTTGRMNWADQKYAIGRGIAAIRHKGDNDLQPLIRGIIESQLPNLLQSATGSTFPNVSAKQLADLIVPDISKEQQHEIAKLLGALAEKIELNRRTNETLEAMARAIFKDWFVDFGPTRAKADGREPYLVPELWGLFPDKLDDDDKPEGWSLSTIGDYIEILDSKRIPLSSREREKRKGIYPYHGATGVMDHVDDYLFEGVHVLLGEDGSVIKEDGAPFTQYVWGKFWVNNHAHVLRGKGISNELLLCFFQQIDITPYVTGAVQLKLNQGNLKRIPFTFPGDKIAAAFDNTVSQLYAKVRGNVDESDTLAQTRDLLLPKLMSGRIRLKDAEKAVEAVA